MQEYKKLLWLSLKSELGESKAYQYLSDMKDIGIDLGVNPKWCIENKQVVYQSIVAWQFGLIESVKILLKELK